MKRFWATLIAILLSCFCAASHTFSQQNTQTQNDSITYSYMLEEVVVYGTRTMRSPSMIIEITAEEIQKRNAVTVADVLRSDPGLTVTTGAKAETETKIRGFPARDVLVLIDGRPINPGYYGEVDLSMLPVDNIAKIRVIKGPASVAYGANSMGGVINIVTKNGLEKPRTVIVSEFGDYEFRKLSMNHSQKVNRFNYWISGYENHSLGFRLSDDFDGTSLEDGSLREQTSFHKLGVNGKLGFEPSARALYALSLGYHWAKKQVPVTIYSWESPRYRDFPDWERFSSSLSGNWHLSPTVELRSILFVDAQHDRFIDYSGPEMRDDQVNWDSKLENWTVGGHMDGKMNAWRNHRLHTGLNFRRDLMNKKPDLDEIWLSHYVYTGTAFVQDNFQPWEKTEVTVGASYNLFGTENDNSFTNKLCPMASVRQSLPLELQVRASYANAIRFPTLHKLYSEGSGNPDLKAEEANKYEIGVERHFTFDNALRSVSLEAVFFHNDLKNLIYRASRSYRFQNIGEAKLQGWELRTNVELSHYLSGDVSYGRIDPGESSEELLEDVSPNKIRIHLSGKTSFGMEAHYEFNYFDERTTYVSDLLLPDYEVHSVNVSQRVGEHLKVHFKVFNLLDTYYEEELGYPQPGRQFFGGVTLTL